MKNEQELKRALKAEISRIGGYWVSVQGGSYSKPGDPDLIACVDGKFVAVEAKTETGVQSPLQKLRERQIKEAGGVYVLARSVDDLITSVALLRVSLE